VGLNNIISNNNFINNIRDAVIVNYIDSPQEMLKIRKNKNVWDSNYWGRQRFLPKIIMGHIRYGGRPPGRGPPDPGKIFLYYNIDWHPAKEPYDLSCNI
jgi:hypothetical protein